MPRLPAMPDSQRLSINDWLDTVPDRFGPTSEPVLVKRVLGDKTRDELISELRGVLVKRPIDLMELRRLGMLISEIYRERGRNWDSRPLREEVIAAFRKKRGIEPDAKLW